MRIIRAGYEILLPTRQDEASRNAIYAAIEQAGRTCYKSESKGDSAGFVRNLVLHGHEAMLEHASMTVKFTVDRGISHEIVRHRMASYAQESSRYCNYSQDRFDNEITVIAPTVRIKPDTESWRIWLESCAHSEEAYFKLLASGEKPEIARNVLPMSLKTELVMTANMREWRHFFWLRALGGAGKPHPQIKEVAVPLYEECARWLPEIFGGMGK